MIFIYSYKATIKITGTLKKTADIMHSMNQLSKIPEISQTIQKFSNEMTKVLLFLFNIYYFFFFFFFFLLTIFKIIVYIGWYY